MLDTEYETTLRRLLCIIPALTTLTLTILALPDVTSAHEIRKLHYHFTTPIGAVSTAFLLLLIFGGMTVLEYHFRGFFLFREWARNVLAVVVVFYAIGMQVEGDFSLQYSLVRTLIFILYSLPFTSPIIIYLIISKRKIKKEYQERMRGNVPNKEENYD